MSTKVKLFPTIEYDTTKREIIIAEKLWDKDSRYMEIVKPINKVLSMKPCEGEIAFTKYVFEKEVFSFRIDNKRRVYLEVFIHTDFMKNNLGKMARFSKIEDYIIDNAPWFFSYGQRFELDTSDEIFGF